jgi:hypothetical protein
MNIWKKSFDKHVYLETENFEFAILKGKQFVIPEIDHNADHHPKCFLLSLCIFIFIPTATTETKNQRSSKEIHPLNIPQLFVIQCYPSQHPLKVLLPGRIFAFEVF